MASTVKITFLADAKKLTAALRALDTDLNKTSKNIQQVGTDLTTKLTVPLAAAGAAGLKLASDWEIAFAQMVGLADVPAEEVARLKQGVLDLAGETAKSPQELAEALYYINSSGIDAADSLEVLDAVARAAAAGLGTTKNVADVVTSAMNAYGKETLSASEATDILVAAVREGKGEPEEYAQVMGRLVPLASKLGVSFNDVAAILAIMTRTGLDAAEASTSLNGIFNTLMGTSKEGEKVLADHGLSLERLRQIAAEPGGVVEVMRLLDQAFEGNIETLDAVIPNIRAMRGVMNVLAQDSESVDEVIRRVTNSTGDAGRAFGVVADTDAMKLKRAWGDLQVALIQIGAAIAPVAGAIASFGGAIFEAFGHLPNWLQTAIVSFGMLVAAIGPAVKIAGFLSTNLGYIGKAATLAFDKMALGAYSAAGALGTVAAATAVVTAGVAILVYAWQRSAQQAAQHKADLKDIEDAYYSNGYAIDLLTEKTQQYLLEQSRFHDRNQIDDLNRLGVSVKDLDQWLTQGQDGLRKFAEAFAASGDAVEVVKDEMGQLWTTQGDYVSSSERVVTINGKMYKGNLDLLDSFVREQGLLEENTKKKIEAALATGDLSEENEKAIQSYLDGSESQTKYTDAAVQFRDVLATVGVQTENAESSTLGLAQSQVAASAAAREMAAAQERATQALDGLWNTMFGGATISADVDGAFSSFNDTMDGTESSGGRAAKAVDLVAEKQKELEDATDDATRAFENFEDQTKQLEKAQKDAAKAQKELDEALKGPDARTKDEAAHDQKEAELDLADAKDKVTEAEKAYQEILANPEATDQEITEAKRDLERANLDLEEANWRATDATQSYTDIANWSAENDPKVAEAREKVAEAQAKVEEETKDTAKAYDEMLQKAQAVQDVENKSLESYANSDAALYNHRLSVNDTKGAYMELAEKIKDTMAAIIAMNISGSAKASEIDKIIQAIYANPYLSKDQRDELLRLAYGTKVAVMDNPNWAGGGTVEMDSGGIVPGPPGQPIGIIAHGGEEIHNTHKNKPTYRGSGGSGVNIGTINMMTNASPQQLARELAWLQKTGLR